MKTYLFQKQVLFHFVKVFPEWFCNSDVCRMHSSANPTEVHHEHHNSCHISTSTHQGAANTTLINKDQILPGFIFISVGSNAAWVISKQNLLQSSGFPEFWCDVIWRFSAHVLGYAGSHPKVLLLGSRSMLPPHEEHSAATACSKRIPMLSQSGLSLIKLNAEEQDTQLWGVVCQPDSSACDPGSTHLSVPPWHCFVLNNTYRLAMRLAISVRKAGLSRHCQSSHNATKTPGRVLLQAVLSSYLWTMVDNGTFQ